MSSHASAHTLGRLTSDQARLHPERVAIVDRGVPLSYGELDARAEALARSLVAAGYRHGDRIATLSGNSADQVVLFFACARSGLVLVPLSWRLTATELAAQLERCDPVVLLAEEEFTAPARAALGRLSMALPLGTLGQDGVERRPPAPRRPDPATRHTEPSTRQTWEAGSSAQTWEAGATAVRDEDPVLMVFTSGTGGRPKAAVLTHATCWWTNLSLSRRFEITADDVVLAVLPQFHVGGWNIQPLLAWWTGARVLLERTFDAGRALRLIAEQGVTTMMGVPTHYQLMTEHPDFSTSDLSRLRQAIVGGASMPAPLLRTYHARGVALTQGYGLTEAGPNVLCVPPEDAETRVGYAGKPYPHVDVALADPVTGQHLVGPATGELLVRGPGLFAGYFRDEPATTAVLRGGWLATGDLATREADGYLRIVDRIKNIYISGGENVSPAEVEAVLRTHPAVADVVVVGVPDQRWGEVGVALVVARPGLPTGEPELLEHCRAVLAGFKVPSRVRFVSELPTVGVGKVARAAALALARDEDREVAR